MTEPTHAPSLPRLPFGHLLATPAACAALQAAGMSVYKLSTVMLAATGATFLTKIVNRTTWQP
jgi:hypothetical protein